jgi:hypothetical protein
MYLPEAIQRLYDHNPNLQIIVALRNPTDRAYSLYWYSRRIGREAAPTFEEALSLELERKEKNPFLWIRTAYRYGGIYHPHIVNLIDRFGKDQVHVVLLEDLRRNPVGACQELFDLVNIDSSFVPDIGARHNVSAIPRAEILARGMFWFFRPQNPIKKTLRRVIPYSVSDRLKAAAFRLNARPFELPPMNPETRQQLVSYFEPFTAQLGELLQRDLGAWNH